MCLCVCVCVCVFACAFPSQRPGCPFFLNLHIYIYIYIYISQVGGAVRCIAIALRCDAKLCVRVEREDSGGWCFQRAVAETVPCPHLREIEAKYS